MIVVEVGRCWISVGGAGRLGSVRLTKRCETVRGVDEFHVTARPVRKTLSELLRLWF